ncbi:myb-like protein X, partial [Cajanus cajan]|uniref:myb-like protein X n=1 Tax=Cajanus cajan TaxID=3821 RepID=UPI0010FAD55A
SPYALQEKQKEKKHKKDKRDKEKRESKEKREKEGRDGKHKEKKDKKEKHKEKKKDKDKDKDKRKDRDKSKINTADDKGIPRQAEGPNASKLHQKEIKQDEKKGVLFENRLTKQYTGNNGEKAREKNHLVEENKDSKFLLEFDRRIRDGDGGASNQLVHKFTNTDHRKDEASVRLVARGGGTWPDGNEKLKDRGPDAKKIDGRGLQAEGRPIGNAPVQNHTGNLHPRVDGIPKLLGKYFERNLEATIEGKEKVKEKKDEQKEKTKEKAERKVKEKKDEGKEKVKEKKDEKRRDKKKDKEKEKKGHGKDKDRDKEKKKEEKAKEHSELKTTELNKLMESNKIGLVDSNSLTQLSKNNHENAVSGENLKKRKDCESNGVPHANDNRPNKLPKLSSTHPFTENGKILEPCQISIPNASVRSGVAAGVKVEKKECKINGFIEAQPFAASSNKIHTATVPADLVTESSAKPPHPDTKYLSQVYSVPKVQHWSDFDDQEWLFGSNVSQEQKSVLKSSEVGETPQVWAEALHIEPADVFALPYVIPY